jgi:Domain of unknown function (DUF4419)
LAFSDKHHNTSSFTTVLSNVFSVHTKLIRGSMPITVKSAAHPARRYVVRSQVSSVEDLLKSACPHEAARSKWIIRSSFLDLSSNTVSAISNGFVHAAINAYSLHHHLTFRPEDVWFAILTQLSFHINANAEELRSFFVAHEGKKHLVIYGGGDIHTADFGGMAVQMTDLMQKNIVDPELKDWVMPDFTTTKQDDQVTAAVLFMGALQKYFTYEMKLRCGIPTVTLLGEKEDWVKIRQRIDFLPRLGKQPKAFAKLLTVILDYFVKSFEEPSAPDVLEFWSKIAERSGGSGINYLSGWITAFCFWGEDGSCQYNSGSISDRMMPNLRDESAQIDGVKFQRIDISKIPGGFASVPVKVDDNGTIYWTKMVAGSMGMKGTSSGQVLDESYQHYGNISPTLEDNIGLDSIQPLTGWLMYEDKDSAMEVGKDETSNLDVTEAESQKPVQKAEKSFKYRVKNAMGKVI